MNQLTSRLLVYESAMPEPAGIADWLGRSIDTDPDVIVVTDEKSIKISHIRDLQAVLSVKPLTKQGRVVIISPANILTLPAQQALLKLLEEPPEATQLVLTVNSRQSLLPTILSRCLIENVQSDLINNDRQVAGPGLIEQIIALKSNKERVELIQSLPNKRDDLQAVLIAELQRSMKNKLSEEQLAKAHACRRQLVEIIGALQGNVSPALCLEKWILSV